MHCDNISGFFWGPVSARIVSWDISSMYYSTCMSCDACLGMPAESVLDLVLVITDMYYLGQIFLHDFILSTWQICLIVNKMPIFVIVRLYYICCKPKEIFAKENSFHKKFLFYQNHFFFFFIKMGLSGHFEHHWSISLTRLWYWSKWAVFCIDPVPSCL